MFFTAADTALTAVSRDKLAAAGETVDGQTDSGWYNPYILPVLVSKCKCIDLVDGEHGCLIASLHDRSLAMRAAPKAPMIPAISGRTAFTAGNLFKTAEHGIIVKGTTLYDDIFSKLTSHRRA